MRFPVAGLPRIARRPHLTLASLPSGSSRPRRRVGDLGLVVVANLWRDDPAGAALAHEGLVGPGSAWLSLGSALGGFSPLLLSPPGACGRRRPSSACVSSALCRAEAEGRPGASSRRVRFSVARSGASWSQTPLGLPRAVFCARASSSGLASSSGATKKTRAELASRSNLSVFRLRSPQAVL